MFVTLEEAKRLLPEDKAKQLLGLVEFEIDPEDFESVQKWLRQCYNRPDQHSLIMCAANELIGGYGVEGLNVEGAWIDNYHGDIVASYVNMGDTYDLTLLLDHDENEFLITSYGDFLEALEAEQAEESEEEEDDDPEEESD